MNHHSHAARVALAAALLLLAGPVFAQRMPSMPSPPSMPAMRTPSFTPSFRQATTSAYSWPQSTWNRAEQYQTRTLQQGQYMIQRAEQSQQPMSNYSPNQFYSPGNTSPAWTTQPNVVQPFVPSALPSLVPPTLPAWQSPQEPMQQQVKWQPAGTALNLADTSTSGNASQPTRHAVLTLSNPTGRDIRYWFRWGQNSSWETHVVTAHGSHWHSWTYETPDADRSPIPYIRFDASFDDQNPIKEYHLDAIASPSTGDEYGKPYHFVDEPDGIHIDLKESM